MNDLGIRTLLVVDSDTVARRNVLYCVGVGDAHSLLGKRFKCPSPPLEITLVAVSTGGSASLNAFAYTGDTVPPGTRLEFHEMTAK